MKIGILGTRGIPNQYGGFEQFAEYLARGLTEIGHDVYVYNPSHHPYQEKTLGKINIIHCKDPAKTFGSFSQFIYDRHCIQDARKRNYDVLLHLGYTSNAVWSSLWPADTVNIVNMDGLEWKRSKYNAITQRFLKWSESRAAAKADFLVADSQGIKEYLKKQYNKNAWFIPYCAEVFSDPDERSIEESQLKKENYALVVARMEPENNIETIIKGYLASKVNYPLLIIGNNENNYGKYLKNKYHHQGLFFHPPLFNKPLLNTLRYFSKIYFHGHSVGGTNPSLLEAMACGCRIAAHDNIFNKAVLGNEGEYFLSEHDIASILDNPLPLDVIEKNKALNLNRIRDNYNPEIIISSYEDLMFRSSQAQVRPGVSSH